jgi:hypothetical protein
MTRSEILHVSFLRRATVRVQQMSSGMLGNLKIIFRLWRQYYSCNERGKSCIISVILGLHCNPCPT